jgi:hypothetical protein
VVNVPGEGPSVRPEDDDYDLLTFAEVRIRLAEEIARVEAAMESALRERKSDAAAQLRSRLRQLIEAQERNTPQRLDPGAFREFFGYEPDHRA